MTKFDYDKEYNKYKFLRIADRHRSQKSARAARVSSLRRNATPPEKSMIHILNYLGIKFVFQKEFDYNAFYVADFFIPPINLIIEVDGSTHFTPQGIRRDTIREKYFKKKGRKMLRIEASAADVITGSQMRKLLQYMETCHPSIILRVDADLQVYPPAVKLL